jgi:threonine dehydrogenase-like Zn-dependent dehydrogenase
MRELYSVPSYSLVHGQGLKSAELALVEPLAIGAHGIRHAGITPGEFVLVMGAGPIGLGTMEFAKLAGGIVIALDYSENRLSFCRDSLHIPYIIEAGSDDIEGQLLSITHGDMPTVVIDATGNLAAINKGLYYLAHGGRYLLIGLQKGEIILSHPEFHKRETTLMSSRNATREDFNQVIDCITKGKINPLKLITHFMSFDTLDHQFKSLLDPASHVIKALVEI